MLIIEKIRKRLFDNWQLVVMGLAIIAVSWPLLMPGYFPHHDDLQVMRIFEMRKCIADGQIPCRWVPDMGFGNGFPLFNYYGVFPYYLGALISFVVGYVWAAKFLFLIPLVMGVVGVYLLARELWGSYSGVVGAVLYCFVPYRAVDIYVRGAVTESFALAVMPFLFYFSLRLIRKGKRGDYVGMGLALSAFLMTQKKITMLFLAILVLWVAYWIWMSERKYRWRIFLSMTAGLGMSLFFLIPAFFEKNLVQVETLTRFDLDYHVHFATLKQLFWDRSWGYGASGYGPFDDMSFQIGWPHWWLVVVAGILALRKKLVLPILLMIGFLVSIFMTHGKSVFIWDGIGLMKFIQFPWRFLGLAILFVSLLGAWVVGLYKNRMAGVVVMILVVVFNFGYFRPDRFYPLSDEQKLTGDLWVQQQGAAILDYLPVGVPEPREVAPGPYFEEGNGEISSFVNRSNRWSVEVQSGEETKLVMPVFDFAGWRVEVDGEEHLYSSDNLLGRISVELPAGEHTVKGVFGNTPVRAVSNAVSFASFVGFIYYAKSKRNFN